MVLDTNCGVFGFDQPSSTAWFRYLLNPILYVQNQMLSVLFDPGSTRDNFDSAWPHTRSPISKSALVEVCTSGSITEDTGSTARDKSNGHFLGDNGPKHKRVARLPTQTKLLRFSG